MNWIVVGIVDIARRRVIPAIQSEPRSRLYGLVSRNPEHAGAEYAPAKVWATLDEALLDAAIDAVYIATPVFLHAPQAIQSLRAGKHVLCEKPMAMNPAESRAMIEAAHACNRTLAAAYYRRKYPKLNCAKELIAGGAIGQPVLAELTSHSWFDGISSDGKQSGRAWLLDPAQAGGGPLFDIASHRIDLLNYLFGQPLRVTGQLSNAVHHYAVEDNATILIEYADGVRGVVDVRWHSKVSRDECRIRGTEGEIDLTPLNGPELRFPGGSESLPPHANLHFPIIKNFVDAVLTGTTPLTSGAASYWTDWVIEQVCEQNSQ
jgi:predicted dehydrogenase